MRSVPTGGVIRGITCAVPLRRVTNRNWEDAVEAARITGVEERRAVGAIDQTDLAYRAAADLLVGVGWVPESVDYLVYVTQTPAKLIPAPGFDLHHRLGLSERCIVFPLNWSCSGFVQGLALAMMLSERAPRSRVLLIAGDTTTTVCDPKNRATAPLFGDAVSATAIEGFGNVGELSFFHMGNDGAGHEELSQDPDGFLHMNGPKVFEFTLRVVPPLVRAVLAERNMPPAYAMFHQANRFMLAHLVKKCKLPAVTQVPMNLQRWGNTSSASIPLLLCEIEEPTMYTRAAIFGFGAGWAWAGANIDVSCMRHRSIVEVSEAR